MEKFKKYIFNNFDGIFILLILVGVTLINYFIYSKVAFLNIYYLPIIITAYYLDRRRAVLGAFLVILMVWIFVLANEEGFLSTEGGKFDLYFNLTVWGSLLIVTAAVIGALSEKVKEELKLTKELSQELDKERKLLQVSNAQLSEYSHNLEEKISERTKELERSHTVIESLKEKVENALFSVLDTTVARMMIEGKLRNEKRRISVLFSDLKGFTSYSDENPPEQVVGELNTYLNGMEDCILKYFGHIDKYMGDGIMAEFGAPVLYQMHSLMAVVAGISMQMRLRQINPNWKMRIGVATGPTVLGLFGSKRKSYSCIGDTANLASRLEGICIPGSLYIDEETYMDVKNYIRTARVYNLMGNRQEDLAVQTEISRLEQKLQDNPNCQDSHFALGQAYFNKRLATKAMEYFEKVLNLNPEHTKAKLAFAEANIKRDEFEKIAIKGKKRRVAVYQVLGLYDPMLNRDKIPAHFYEKYHRVASKITIPEAVVLPIEMIDGSVYHGKITAIISYAIAEQLGLSDKEKEELLIAGYLHDLGKEIISHEILERQEKLTAAETTDMKKHPTESVRIMKQMGYESESLLKIVECHHEHYNGFGYPFGLIGDNIPLGARILSIADAFEVMTSRRLQAEAWEYRSAIREIEKDASNGMYDPKCVRALKELFII